MSHWHYVTEQKRRVSIGPVNWSSWLLWGFVATVVLTTLLAGSQGLGITRMNVPYLLGTMVTPNRDRAKLIGVLLHFINGWLFSLIYVAAFQLVGRSTWWFGGLIGLVHGSFVLAVALPALPAFASAHGQRAVRADRCAATGAAWFSRSALRHSHTDIGPRRTHDLWRDPRGFLRGEVIVTSDDYL